MFVQFKQLKLRMIKIMVKVPSIHKQIINKKHITDKEFVFRKGVGEHKLENISDINNKSYSIYKSELLKNKDFLIHNHIYRFNKQLNGYKSLLVIPSVLDIFELLKRNITKDISTGVISIIKKENGKPQEVGRTHFKIINDKLKLFLINEFKKNATDISQINVNLNLEIYELCKKNLIKKKCFILKIFLKIQII